MQSNDELISSNVTEKETKIIFLQKLITFLERCLDTNINVKPAKIVAGLDPERTRYLLQLFTVVATMKDLELRNSIRCEPRIEEPASVAIQVDKEEAANFFDRTPAQAKLTIEAGAIEVQPMVRDKGVASPNQESLGKSLQIIDSTPALTEAVAMEVQLKISDEAPFVPLPANLNARPTTARGPRPSIKAISVVRPVADIIKEQVGCQFEEVSVAILDVDQIKGCNDFVDQTQTMTFVADNKSIVKQIKGCNDGVDQAQKTISKSIYKPLPAQMSDINFESLARAIRDISHSTTFMAKHITSIPDNVEKLMKERRRWIAEL